MNLLVTVVQLISIPTKLNRLRNVIYLKVYKKKGKFQTSQLLFNNPFITADLYCTYIPDDCSACVNGGTCTESDYPEECDDCNYGYIGTFCDEGIMGIMVFEINLNC